MSCHINHTGENIVLLNSPFSLIINKRTMSVSPQRTGNGVPWFYKVVIGDAIMFFCGRSMHSIGLVAYGKRQTNSHKTVNKCAGGINNAW